MFNFIKNKLSGVKTISTQETQIYVYDTNKKELVLREGPLLYPAHLLIKKDIMFLYAGEQIKKLLEAKIFSDRIKEQSLAIQEALKDPTQIYEILGSEKEIGLVKYRVQKMNAADKMEVHLSSNFFSIHSQYDYEIRRYLSVAQFFN